MGKVGGLSLVYFYPTISPPKGRIHLAIFFNHTTHVPALHNFGITGSSLWKKQSGRRKVQVGLVKSVRWEVLWKCSRCCDDPLHIVWVVRIGNITIQGEHTVQKGRSWLEQCHYYDKSRSTGWFRASKPPPLYREMICCFTWSHNVLPKE